MKPGDRVADFELPDQTGTTRSLSALLADGPVVLFFYPAANTPGCTAEACHFRDLASEFKEVGASRVGISVDSVEDQKAFSDKYKLPFPVLSDVGGATSEAYGVLREMGSTGIANRETFLVDPQGVIVKHYEEVDPETHTQDVVADLQTLREDYSPAG